MWLGSFDIWFYIFYSAYSTHGCVKIDEDERSVSCQSNHTTSFAVLLQVTSYPIDEPTVCCNWHRFCLVFGIFIFKIVNIGLHVLKIEWKTKASSILIQYVLINLYIVILFYITDIQSSPTHSKLTDKNTEFHIYHWIINYHRGILVNTVGDMGRWLCPMKIYF